MIHKLIFKNRVKENRYLSDIINLGLILFILFIIGLIYYKYHDKDKVIKSDFIIR